MNGCSRIGPRSGDAEVVPARALKTACLCLIIATLFATSVERGAAQSVLSYHGTQDRSGNFVVPRLTWDNAQNVHLDESFRARISGHLYAQPLYWRVPGTNSAMLLVATEENVVYAIDAQSGREIWRRALGKSIPRSSLSCGNINPLGITGTPVIDDDAQAIFLDSAIENESGQHHLVFGLALKDGSILQGWPVDVAQALSRQRIDFVARDQNQRGALAILDGTVYVPFGGHFGDCGEYHGVVVGISLSDPRKVSSWATRARGGGIWAPAGLSTDGKSLFAATGNTIGTAKWGDGEAVIRLAPDLRHSTDNRDFFAPEDWHALDARDADLGGTNPLPLDVPTSTASQNLIIALGKDGKAYLLDRNNLGGIGGALVTQQVAQGQILGAPAAYPGARRCVSRVCRRRRTLPFAYIWHRDHCFKNSIGLTSEHDDCVVRKRPWSRITYRDNDGWTRESDCLDPRRGRRQSPPRFSRRYGRVAHYNAKRSAHWSSTFPNPDCHTGAPFRRRG